LLYIGIEWMEQREIPAIGVWIFHERYLDRKHLFTICLELGRRELQITFDRKRI
jgi:hypothetical protein